LIHSFYKKSYIYDNKYKIKSREVIKERLLNKQTGENFNTKFSPKFAEKDLIYGHFKLQKYEHLNRPFVTFLRDPVNRLISQYYYQLHLLGDMDIQTYAEIYANHMTFILGSDLKKLEFIGIQEFFDESVNKFLNHFNLPKILRMEKRRVGKKVIVQKSIRKYIARLNKEDYELYNEAVNILKGKR